MAEPVGANIEGGAKSMSKSAVSRRFVKETEADMSDVLARGQHVAVTPESYD